MRKEQYGDALDHYFRLGKNLNQRDTIAVRRMVDGYLKLIYPDGEFTKDELEEVLKLALEMRRRVKEQLKKLGGMEFYDVNFSYIDKDAIKPRFVPVKETADEPVEQEPETEIKGILARGKGFFKKAGEAIGDTFTDLNAKVMVFSEENFKNKKAMERQMLFYGVICLYNEGLETFVNA